MPEGDRDGGRRPVLRPDVSPAAPNARDEGEHLRQRPRRFRLVPLPRRRRQEGGRELKGTDTYRVTHLDGYNLKLT